MPVEIGAPIPFEALKAIKDRQVLADELRARTYALASAGLTRPVKANPAKKLIGKLRGAASEARRLRRQPRPR